MAKSLKKFISEHDIIRLSLLSLVIFFVLFIFHISLTCILNYLYKCFPDLEKYISQNNCDISSTLIPITFTIMGFSVTLRNILLARDNNNYLNFSMKNLIELSTTTVCKIAWYLVLSIPVFSLFVFAAGYRKRLYLLVVISAVCIIYYFVTILKRLSKKEFKNTLVYIMLDNLIYSDSNDSSEYRRNFFNRLCDKSNNMVEMNAVFRAAIDTLVKIIMNENGFVSKSFIRFGRSYIENKVIKNIRRNFYCKEKEKKKLLCKKINCLSNDSLLKNFSIYVFDYYNCLFNNLPDYDCHLVIIRVEELIDEFLNNIKECSNKHSKKNLLCLYLNYILGLFIACLINLDLDTVVDLFNSIKAKNSVIADFPDNSAVNVIMTLSINYVNECELFKKSVKLKDLQEFFDNISIHTICKDYDDLFEILFTEFNVFDNDNTLEKVNEVFIYLKKYTYLSYPLF